MNAQADIPRLVRELRERTGLDTGKVCRQAWRDLSHHQPLGERTRPAVAPGHGKNRGAPAQYGRTGQRPLAGVFT